MFYNSYNSFAKSDISYALMLFGTAAKTNPKEVEKKRKLKRIILRAVYSRRKLDSLNHIWYQQKIPIVFEMYVSELIKKMFNQIRLDSPVQFFLPHTSKVSHLLTCGSSRNNIPSKCYRTVVKR